MKRTNAAPAGANGNSGHTSLPEVTEQKGDLLILNLWKQGTNSVHEMRAVNTDAPTYQKKDPEKFLHEADRGKKKMYLEACLQQLRHFSPLCFLGGWAAGGGGDGYPEKDSQLPDQVEAILLLTYPHVFE